MTSAESLEKPQRRAGCDRRRPCLFGVALGLAATVVHAVEPILPLEAIEPGMRGEWRTVVSGSDIQSFELEILGVLEHFAGPRQPVILAQALDPVNLLSGPVGGMSGSPVYIDDQLIGAYAYGFMWPKEQAIIGITPIEQMLDIVETFPMQAPEGAHWGVTATAAEAGSGTGAHAAPASHSRAHGQPATVDHTSGAQQPFLERLRAPLFSGGFSPKTLAAFAPRWRSLGLEPMLAGAGGGSGFAMAAASAAAGEGAAAAMPLAPGSPIAAVLMTGDFEMAATGTVTWAQDGKVLGFGHPFLQWGHVAVPMASAEVLTVVRNVQRSFKMSKTGPILGTIFQDRLTGIAGRLGPAPEMIPLSIRWLPEEGEARALEATMVDHPQLLPLLTAMSLVEAGRQTLERSERQTLTLEGLVQFKDLPPVALSHTAVGADAFGFYAQELLDWMQRLLLHPDRPAAIADVALEVRVEDTWSWVRLLGVERLDARVLPGEVLPLALTFEAYQGEPERVRVEVPLPETLRRGEHVKVLVSDAAGLEAYEGNAVRFTRTVEEAAAQWRERRPDGRVYVALLRLSPGVEVGGRLLQGLPPSVSRALAQGAASSASAPVPEGRIVWETTLPLEGALLGSQVLDVVLD